MKCPQCGCSDWVEWIEIFPPVTAFDSFYYLFYPKWEGLFRDSPSIGCSDWLLDSIRKGCNAELCICQKCGCTVT